MGEVKTLDCRLQSALDWKLEEGGEKISWELDCGWELFFPMNLLAFEEELLFSSWVLAMDHFSKEIWPLYKEKTERIILYRGGIDFGQGDEAYLRALVWMDRWVHFLELLMIHLPEEVPISLVFDVRGQGSFAKMQRLLSKERFVHFQVELIGGQGDPNAKVALCFPEEKRGTLEVLSVLDGWALSFPSPFRVIHESFLTEEWEGVDCIYALQEAMSPQGKRKLLGFEATGGEVKWIRGRGI